MLMLNALVGFGARRRGGLDAVIMELFASGEQGAWYDPSDLSTMFQDVAGTTPVTADGQPVGLILDKSRGLATTPTTISGNMNTSTWTKGVGWTAPGPQSLSCDGSNIGNSDCSASFSPPASTITKWTFNIVSVVGAVSVYATSGVPVVFTTPGIKTVYADRVANYSIFRASAGTVCSITNIQIKSVASNHASQATAASRPLYKTDGTYSWLQFDGVDDSLSTGAIDFTGTDKISVFAGIYKNTNSVGIVSELSANGAGNQGAFYIVSGTDNGGEYTFSARGSAFSIAKVFAYVAPDTAVIACISNIPADLNQISRNTVAGQSGTSDLGAVNFGNYPLYIGRRAESSLPLNGKIYSLIVRGALSTTQEITDTETWVNSKTGAY